MNKTKRSVNWPNTSYFTLQDTFKANPEWKHITIRSRLTSEGIETGMFKQIGHLPGGKGRSQNVYARTPVSKITLDKAEADGIVLSENRDTLVQVATITTPSVSPVVIPTPSSVVA